MFKRIILLLRGWERATTLDMKPKESPSGLHKCTKCGKEFERTLESKWCEDCLVNRLAQDKLEARTNICALAFACFALLTSTLLFHNRAYELWTAAFALLAFGAGLEDTFLTALAGEGIYAPNVYKRMVLGAFSFVSVVLAVMAAIHS